MSLNLCVSIVGNRFDRLCVWICARRRNEGNAQILLVCVCRIVQFRRQIGNKWNSVQSKASTHQFIYLTLRKYGRNILIYHLLLGT